MYNTFLCFLLLKNIFIINYGGCFYCILRCSLLLLAQGLYFIMHIVYMLFYHLNKTGIHHCLENHETAMPNQLYLSVAFTFCYIWLCVNVPVHIGE